MPGCLEHDYTIYGRIRMARRQGKPLYICGYDFADAYGSLNHSLIQYSLKARGFEDSAIAIIMSMYDQTGFWINTKSSNTRTVTQKHGVKQEDPCSPIIFNLCVETLSRHLNALSTPGINEHNHLMLADNLMTISNNPEMSRRMHNMIVEFCNATGIVINTSKCELMESLPTGRNRRKVDRDFYLSINKENITPIEANGSFRYLGNQVGMNCKGIQGQFRKLLDETKALICKIGNSQLRIHQKNHALRTFILPKFEYFIRLNGLGKHHGKLLSQAIRTKVVKYIRLSKSTSLVFFHSSVGNGGLGLPEPNQWACCTQIVHVLGLLNSQDPVVRELAMSETQELIKN